MRPGYSDRLISIVMEHLGHDLEGHAFAQARAAGLLDCTDCGPPVTDADIKGLPAPAQRYLGFMEVVGHPMAQSFSVQMKGEFRLKPGRPWMHYESFQINTCGPIGRIYCMRIDAMGVLPMVGGDTYIQGHGLMDGKLLGVIPVAHGEGNELDIGELTTWLNDAVLMAPSMLLRAGATWEAEDHDSFTVAIADGPNSVQGRVWVDREGRPTLFESDDRFVSVGGPLHRARWSTPVSGWVTEYGQPHFSEGSAVWDLEDGPFEYARSQLRDGDLRVGLVELRPHQ